MTKEKQRITIAKYCGIKYIGKKFRCIEGEGCAYEDLYGTDESGYEVFLPEYLYNLDDIHEVINTKLNDGQKTIFGLTVLSELNQTPPLDIYEIITVNAEVLSRVFLKTINKWEE